MSKFSEWYSKLDTQDQKFVNIVIVVVAIVVMLWIIGLFSKDAKANVCVGPPVPPIIVPVPVPVEVVVHKSPSVPILAPVAMGGFIWYAATHSEKPPCMDRPDILFKARNGNYYYTVSDCEAHGFEF